jgi:hypothetical protein
MNSNDGEPPTESLNGWIEAGLVSHLSVIKIPQDNSTAYMPARLRGTNICSGMSALLVCLFIAVFWKEGETGAAAQLPFTGIYAIELKEIYRIAYAQTGFTVSSSTSSPEKLSVSYRINGSSKPYIAEIVFANDTQWCNCSSRATHTVLSDGVPEGADSATITQYLEQYRMADAEAAKLLPIRSPVVRNLAGMVYKGLSFDDVLHVYEQAFKEAGFHGGIVHRANSVKYLLYDLHGYVGQNYNLWISFTVDGDSSTLRVIPKLIRRSRPVYFNLDKRKECMEKFQEMDQAAWNIINSKIGKFAAKRTEVSE